MLPKEHIYLPREGKYHYSDHVTWNGGRGKATYIKKFFHGRDVLNTPAIRFGSHIMDVLENDGENPLVADLPRHPYIEYDLECMLGGVIPIFTHPDSVDIDNTLGVLEYKTALEKNAWTPRMVGSQKQISFYQMCIRELKGGDWNPEENYIVEIPTQRLTHEQIDGVAWENTGEEKYLEIGRKVLDDGCFAPVKLHQRVVTKAEIDKLRNEVIDSALEISGIYKEFLEGELKKIE